MQGNDVVGEDCVFRFSQTIIIKMASLVKLTVCFYSLMEVKDLLCMVINEIIRYDCLTWGCYILFILHKLFSFIHSKTLIDILTSIVLLFLFYALDCVNLTLMLTRRSEGHWARAQRIRSAVEILKRGLKSYLYHMKVQISFDGKIDKKSCSILFKHENSINGSFVKERAVRATRWEPYTARKTTVPQKIVL